MNTEYTIKLPDGDEVIMEIDNKKVPSFDMDKLKGNELKDACAALFSNLGWEVKKEVIVALDKGTFYPDIVLSENEKEYGYVEVITSMEPKDLYEKQKTINVIVDECKPEIFVLTNGKVFDVFYEGKFEGTVSVPPTPTSLRTRKRLMAYYKAVMNHQGEKKDDNV